MRANRSPFPFHDRNRRAKTRPFALHEVNPAGTKNVLRWYKAKHGAHASSVEEAWEWYRAYMKDLDSEAREAEQKRKEERLRRRFPWLANRLLEPA